MAPREWAVDRAGETWFDPFVVLSAAAAVTERVRLLTDVIVLPYRSPFVAAKAGGSLDVISGGRLVFGCAAGYLEREFRILGAEFGSRGAWTDEAIEVIKKAWSQDWMSFEGRFQRAHDVAVAPRPVQQPRPPIWVGGNSMRALRRALELGDGWTPFRGDPVAVKEMLTRARDRWSFPEAFDVCVPLRGRIYRGDTIDADAIASHVEALAASGVTHCKVAFRGPTVGEYVQGMEEFAAHVIPRCSA